MLKKLLVLSLSLTTLSCGWFSKISTRPNDAVVMGISYVGVSVADLDSSVQLYQDTADLIPVQRTSIEEHGLFDNLSSDHITAVDSVLLKSANTQLRFMQFQTSNTPLSMQPVPVNGNGIAHVCFQVNQTTNTYQRFLELGASHIGAEEMIQINPRNPVYYAYANDPEGILVEIEEVNVAKLEVETPPEHNYRIRQISLATPNIDRLLAFYSILLEEQHPRRIGKWLNLSGDKIDNISGLPGSEIEMAWFQTRNLELEIVQYHSHPPAKPESPRPVNATGYNLIMFEVSDLAKTTEKLNLAGAEIVAQDQTLDGMPVVLARDPDGNLLGFQTTQPGNPLSAAQFKNNGL